MSNIGRIIYGLCHGKFGDSYHDKRIEAEGVDWVIARRCDGYGNAEPEFASFRDEQEKNEYIAEWSQRPEEEE